MQVVCDQKINDDICEGCHHSVTHEPIDITPFKETCANKRAVCMSRRAECLCIPR
jgi:hypothetical protein